MMAIKDDRKKDAQLKELRILNGILQAKVNELQSDHRDCSTTVDDLRHLKKDAQQECVTLHERLRLAADELKALPELRESYSKMERAYEAALQENQQFQLQADREKLRNTDEIDDTDDDLRSTIQQLQANIAQLNAEIQTKHERAQKLLAENEKQKIELQEQFEYIEVDNEKAVQQQLEIDALKKRVQEMHQAIEDTSKERLQFQQDNIDLAGRFQELDEHYHHTIAENGHKFEAFKSEAAEAESRLVQENLILQKQLIDLQSDLNSKNADCPPAGDEIAFKQSIATLLLPYVRIDAAAVSLADTLKLLGETLATIDANRADLDEIMDKFETLTEEKNRIEHDRATIKADLHHYEIEVAELMKNNEVLLLEIETLKTGGKLETISEQNEDNIICLEKQLEDCSQLNQSLEDEYQEMRDQLEKAETDRQSASDEVQRLTDELGRKEARILELQHELDAAGETDEKQLNAIRAEASGVHEEFQQKLNESEAQLIVVRSENAKTLNDLAEAQRHITELDQLRNDYHSRLSEAGKLITKKNNDIEELIDEMRTLKSEKVTIESECVTLQSELKRVQTELDETAVAGEDRHQLEQTIEMLQQQLAAESTNDAEVQQLQQALATVTDEKAQLIALITAKHEENVKYHGEIQRLGQMLNAEIGKECLRCNELTRQIEEVKSTASEQLEFMREKNDLLGKNVLHESGQQQQLQQQISALQTDKQNLAKDVERLRGHLLEIEDAHTLETVELQKTIDSTNQKMYALQEDVRKSSTAYTSAR